MQATSDEQSSASSNDPHFLGKTDKTTA